MFAGSDFRSKKDKNQQQYLYYNGKNTAKFITIWQFTRAKPYSIINYCLYHCTFYRV